MFRVEVAEHREVFLIAESDRDVGIPDDISQKRLDVIADLRAAFERRREPVALDRFEPNTVETETGPRRAIWRPRARHHRAALGEAELVRQEDLQKIAAGDGDVWLVGWLLAHRSMFAELPLAVNEIDRLRLYQTNDLAALD